MLSTSLRQKVGSQFYPREIRYLNPAKEALKHSYHAMINLTSFYTLFCLLKYHPLISGLHSPRVSPLQYLRHLR